MGYHVYEMPRAIPRTTSLNYIVKISKISHLFKDDITIFLADFGIKRQVVDLVYILSLIGIEDPLQHMKMNADKTIGFGTVILETRS